MVTLQRRNTPPIDKVDKIPTGGAVGKLSTYRRKTVHLPPENGLLTKLKTLAGQGFSDTPKNTRYLQGTCNSLARLA